MAETEAMDADARPVQIVRLDMEENRVEVDNASLELIGENLRKTNADAVSIVSIMGTYRTGKSFLLDLLMRYLRCWERAVAVNSGREEKRLEAYRAAEWSARISEGKSDAEAKEIGTRAGEEAVKDMPEMSFPDPQNEEWRCKSQKFPPPAWIQQGSTSSSKAGFEWRGGMDKCTEGIWLWSRPFVLPNKGRKIAVLLMDTQGAWDGVMTKEQNATIFGLTALLASKLICNVQNMLSDDKIDSIDYFATFAQAACTGFACDGAPFGDLEFVIRDWAWYEAGASFQDCRQTMDRHLRSLLNSNVQGRDELRERLESTFKSISCHGLPHPGLAVLDPGFKGDFEDIGSDFSQLLGEFCRGFFREGEFPKPSVPLGMEISPAAFENTVRNFVEAFSDTKGSAVQLREAFVKVELFKTRDLLLQQFRQRMELAAPESRVVDPDAFAAQEANIRADLKRQFQAKIGTFRVPDQEKQLRDFMETIGQALDRRRRENLAELEAAQLKLVATPLVGGGVFFALGHPFLDTLVMMGVLYLQAKKHAAALEREVVDFEVVRHLAGDVKSFSQQRARDVQAMTIAAQRCTPTSAVQRIGGVLGQASVATGSMLGQQSVRMVPAVA